MGDGKRREEMRGEGIRTSPCACACAISASGLSRIDMASPLRSRSANDSVDDLLSSASPSSASTILPNVNNHQRHSSPSPILDILITPIAILTPTLPIRILPTRLPIAHLRRERLSLGRRLGRHVCVPYIFSNRQTHFGARFFFRLRPPNGPAARIYTSRSFVFVFSFLFFLYPFRFPSSV